MSHLNKLAISLTGHAKLDDSFEISFDLAKPTQKFIHDVLKRGQLCDPPMVQALTERLGPGDTFIDIGSHVGYYSLLAALKVGPTGRVFAFEANPETYLVLLANALSNKRLQIQPIQAALSDQKGILSFQIHPGDEGQSSLVDKHRENGNSRLISVLTTTLDDILETIPFGKVKTVKIDVEGFEEQVLHGGRRFLDAVQPENIVFEVNNMISSDKQNPDLAIREFLSKLGYRCYLIRPWHSPEYQMEFGNSNYLEIPLGIPIDIRYGNILATFHSIKAPKLDL